MGRKKITIEKIEAKKDRIITFCKRKLGILKKAAELAILCDIRVYLAFTDINGCAYQFDSYRNNSNNPLINKDQQSMLEKIRTGDYTAYDISHYPFDELKSIHTLTDMEKENKFTMPNFELTRLPNSRSNQDMDSNSSSGDEETDVQREAPSQSTPILICKETAPAFLGNPFLELPLEPREFREGESKPSLGLNVEPDFEVAQANTSDHAPAMESQDIDKSTRKLRNFTASFLQAKSPNGMWLFLQTGMSENAKIFVSEEKVGRLRTAFRKDLLKTAEDRAMSMIRNDSRVIENAVVYFFLDRFLESYSMERTPVALEMSSFLRRMSNVCSITSVNILASDFSFVSGNADKEPSRVRYMSEFFLRRFLEPTVPTSAPPQNPILSSLFANLIRGYFQDISLLRWSSNCKSIREPELCLDEGLLSHLQFLIELTLRIMLREEVDMAPPIPLVDKEKVIKTERLSDGSEVLGKRKPEHHGKKRENEGKERMLKATEQGVKKLGTSSNPTDSIPTDSSKPLKVKVEEEF